MFSRYLGGVAACLGVAGPLAAQPAATLGRPQPTVTQVQHVSPAAKPPAQRVSVAVPSARPVGTGAPPAEAAPPPKPAAVPQPPAPPPMAYGPSASYGMISPQGCAVGCADCPTDCSACDCLCGPPGRFWVSAEWLYWATSGNRVPPLVTTAPPGTARAVAGTLGGPGTTVLYGGREINDDFRSGFRVRAGFWLDECQLYGLEADFFWLDQADDTFAAGSNGTQIIMRPFVNALTGAPDTQLVSFPGVLSGTVAVNPAETEFFGGGVNYLHNLCCTPCGRLDLLLGYRYLNLQDDLNITEDLVALPGAAVPAGTRFLVNDRFQTENQFHGAVIGLNWERRWGYWFAGVRASVALGVTKQDVDISGTTIIIPPGGAPVTQVGGLLAQPSNIGSYSDNRFAVVPEVGVRLGVQLTDALRAYVGYNVLYWSSVVRAGDQIDLTVNPTLIAPRGAVAGPARPAFTPRTTDFWAHGVSLGVEFRF